MDGGELTWWLVNRRRISNCAISIISFMACYFMAWASMHLPLQLSFWQIWSRGRCARRALYIWRMLLASRDAIKTEWSDLSSRDLPCIFSFYLLYLIILTQEISMSLSSFRYYRTFLGTYAPSFLGHRRDLNVSCWQCSDCSSVRPLWPARNGMHSKLTPIWSGWKIDWFIHFSKAN